MVPQFPLLVARLSWAVPHWRWWMSESEGEGKFAKEELGSRVSSATLVPMSHCTRLGEASKRLSAVMGGVPTPP
ncbi:hypothetical protein D3C72_1439130 [compost metagenome]